MKSLAVKRAIFAIGLLIAFVLAAAAWFLFEITRDPGVSWETPTSVEDAEVRRKIKLYDTSISRAQHGFVRFSPSEINAFLTSISTNAPLSTNSFLALKRVGIDITRTNITFSSLAERRVFNYPVRVIIQRGFHVHQLGTNHWDLPMDWLKVGHIEVPKKHWHRLSQFIRPLDQPLMPHLVWATNIEAMLVTKNDLSQRPELRLYTYKPIPPGDRK